MTNLDIDKITHSILYVLEQTGAISIHKLAKILYFADKYHLAKYGRMITGETYIAMKYGPVPSFTYDIYKYLKGVGLRYKELESFKQLIEFKHSYHLAGLANPDLDELSVSDVKCLNKSIDTYKNSTFNQLTNDSHDSAWDSANDDLPIDFMEIAKASTNDEGMLIYISESIENQHLTFR